MLLIDAPTWIIKETSHPMNNCGHCARSKLFYLSGTRNPRWQHIYFLNFPPLVPICTVWLLNMCLIMMHYASSLPGTYPIYRVYICSLMVFILVPFIWRHLSISVNNLLALFVKWTFKISLTEFRSDAIFCKVIDQITHVNNKHVEDNLPYLKEFQALPVICLITESVGRTSLH